MSQPLDQWGAFVIVAAGIGSVFLIVPLIRYELGENYLRVALGGVTLRKIPFSDIEFVDTKAPLWNEHWCNAFITRGRIVRIRRKSGLVRNFIITPKDRETFIQELQARIASR